MSLFMMYALGIAYLIIMVACGIERRWSDAMYWLGAGIITASLIIRR